MACSLSFIVKNERVLKMTGSRVHVRRAESHHRAEFHQNRSICLGDIAIFLFFKMAAAAILDFRNREILMASGVWRA